MIYLNNKKIEIVKFPNGESLIKTEKLEINTSNEVKMKFESDADITHLMFIKEHLDELGVKSNLVIGYMPYSRMDRTEGMTVFTLKYITKMINRMGFETVTVYEPHSDVSIALLDRVKVENMSQEIANELIKEFNIEDNIYIVYPDAGAAKRYSKETTYNKILTANKERDFETGYIKKLDINGKIEGDKFKAIIVDDLCSRGGTFIMTAEKLKEMGAEEIYLVVTHCEDTIFEGEILTGNLIDRVYTTNTILTKEHEKINIKKVI